MPIWPARSPGTTRQRCTMATTPSMGKKCSLSPIPLWVCGRLPDFPRNSARLVRRMRLRLPRLPRQAVGWTAHNSPRCRHTSQDPAQEVDLRLFRYIAPLYAVAGAKFRIEQTVWLQHFHFWCLQSSGLRRDFFDRKSCTLPNLTVRSGTENALKSSVWEG